MKLTQLFAASALLLASACGTDPLIGDCTNTDISDPDWSVLVRVIDPEVTQVDFGLCGLTVIASDGSSSERFKGTGHITITMPLTDCTYWGLNGRSGTFSIFVMDPVYGYAVRDGIELTGGKCEHRIELTADELQTL